MAPAPKPPKNAAVQGAQRLKAALQTKLVGEELTQGQKDSIYQAILVVERFLKFAKGTVADLEGLKAQVKAIIKNGGSGSTRTLSASKGVPPPAPAPVRVIKSAGRQGKTPPAAVAPKALSSSGPTGVDTSLPPITIERQGRSKLNKFGQMAILQDQAYVEEMKAKKERVKSMQMQMRDDLHVQMEYQEAKRQADMRAKAQEAADLEDKLKKYERQDAEKLRLHKEKVKAEKVARAEQARVVRERAEAEKVFARAEDKRMLEDAMAETAAINALKKQQAADQREMLKNVQEENIQRKRIQMVEKEKEKLNDIEIAKLGEELALKKEKQRQLENEKILEKQKRMLIAGGADEIAEQKARKMAEEEARLKALQEESDRRYHEALEAKQLKKERDEAATLAVLNQQVAFRAAVRKTDLDEKQAYAKMINEDHAEYVRKEQDLKAYRRKIAVAHKDDVVKQIHSDMRRKYDMAYDDMNDSEMKLNRHFLDQIEGTKIA